MALFEVHIFREKRVRDAQRQMDRQVPEGTLSPYTAVDYSNSTSVMLVVIVSIFLVVNLPQAVFMALLCVYSTFEISSSLFEVDLGFGVKARSFVCKHSNYDSHRGYPFHSFSSPTCSSWAPTP